MPQYLFHIPVVLLPLSEPDKRISHTYGSLNVKLEPKPSWKRASFKLPAAALHRLKAYAAATRQFQYAVVHEALELYLPRAIDTSDFRERAALTDLEQHYERQHQPVKPAPESGRPTADSAAPASPDLPAESSVGLAGSLAGGA